MALEPPHLKSHKQYLRVRGGDKYTVEFSPDLKGQKVSQMSFWSQRLTDADPFSFRVYAKVDSNWKEVYNGDEKIKAGCNFFHPNNIHEHLQILVYLTF